MSLLEHLDQTMPEAKIISDFSDTSDFPFA